MIGAKVIARSPTGDSLKGDQPEGAQAYNQKQLKCHWELNDAGALQMIWSNSLDLLWQLTSLLDPGCHP